MLALLNSFAFGRFLAWLASGFTKRAVKNWIIRHWAIITSLVSGLTYNLFPTLWERAYKEVDPLLEAAALTASTTAAKIAKNMTGLPFDAGDLASVVGNGWTDAERSKVGAGFLAIFDDIFRTAPIASGYLHRDPGSQEREAFKRFIGRNAQLQSAGIMLDLIKDKLPKDLLLGLGDMVDRGEKIMGFEDSQEEIMEPLMEKLIITGMEKYYNRLTLPVDLTPSDAIGMYIKGYLTRPLMDKVLDNEGVRNDIREMLIQDQAKNPTHADMVDLYQRGVWDHAAVVAAFRQQGYLADDANLKAAILESDRQWKLAYQLADVYEQQFVKSVIQQGEYEGYLRNLQYTADEVNVLLETARRKKTLAATTQAKHITGSFNITPERVKEGASAIIKWNIRNADHITITGLGTVGHRGEQPLLVPRSQTYTLTATTDAGDREEFFAYVEVRGQPEVRLPHVELSLSPRSGPIGSLRELRWNVSRGDAVTLDGTPVPPQGVHFVTPVLPTFYTLSASNIAGSATTQDVALIELPDDLIDPAVKPSVTFAITPLVVDAKQPRIEIKWGTVHSNNQRLTYPDGHSIDVAHNGAMIELITASGIFTFEATNDRGTTRRQEAVIFKEGAPEEPPPPPGGNPPIVNLNTFPQTVTPGTLITITWLISGTNEGTFINYDGGLRTVGQSGSTQVTMPATPGTYIFRLQATNAGGPASTELPVVVS